MAAKPMRSNTFAIATGSGAAYSMNSNPSVPIGFSQGVNFIPLAYLHRQPAETAEADAPVALRGAVPLDLGKALQQAGKGDPPLHARYVHADADVVAVAEGDLPVGLARVIEVVLSLIHISEPTRLLSISY